MTQDEIIEMVREAGGSDVGGHGWTTWVGTQSTEFLERFAKLVEDKAAAKEREACAKLCESYVSESPYSWGGTTIAAAIRARGEQA
jgi:DNA-binding SARP family transcriptional activator